MKHHSFDIAIAKRYDAETAIILNYINYWIEQHKGNKRYYHEGKYWVYFTHKQLAEYFEYIRPRKIRSIIENLINEGVLHKGNYNEKKFDRTAWYALTIPYDSICETGQLHLTNLTNGSDKSDQPIPLQTTLQTFSKPLKVSDKKSDYKKFVELWFLFYEKQTGRKPSFTSIGGKKIKSIEAKIKVMAPERNTVDFFKNMLDFYDQITDKWLKDNMLDLNIFDSKFDLIINNLKKGYDTEQDRKDRYHSYLN